MIPMTDEQTRRIDALRAAVGARLSPPRFAHTLGVEKTAVSLGEIFLPDRLFSLSAAALLHDIAKELPIDRQRDLAQRSGLLDDPSDFLCRALYHAYAAVSLIRAEFPDFATDEILSAVAKHTVGAPDMSVADEIIFLSDYIEPTRTYPDCVAVRDDFFSQMEQATNPDGELLALHRAALRSMDLTLEKLIRSDKYIGAGLISSRNSLLARIFPT